MLSCKLSPRDLGRQLCAVGITKNAWTKWKPGGNFFFKRCFHTSDVAPNLPKPRTPTWTICLTNGGPQGQARPSSGVCGPNSCSIRCREDAQLLVYMMHAGALQFVPRQPFELQPAFRLASLPSLPVMYQCATRVLYCLACALHYLLSLHSPLRSARPRYRSDPLRSFLWLAVQRKELLPEGAWASRPHWCRLELKKQPSTT